MILQFVSAYSIFRSKNLHFMDKKPLIKNFTIGFIPLLIFIVADELFGTRIGLIVAVTVGIGEFLFFLIKYKQVEKESKPDEIYVITKDYVKYHFSDSDFYIENDTLYGNGKLISSDKIERKFALSDIGLVEVENFNWGNTILLSAGIYLGIGLIVGIIIGIRGASES